MPAWTMYRVLVLPSPSVIWTVVPGAPVAWTTQVLCCACWMVALPPATPQAAVPEASVVNVTMFPWGTTGLMGRIIGVDMVRSRRGRGPYHGGATGTPAAAPRRAPAPAATGRVRPSPEPAPPPPRSAARPARPGCAAG